VSAAPIDFSAINRRALSRLPDLLRRWLPGGRLEGREYVVKNPLRHDQSPGSFSINTDTGHWADFIPGGPSGGDPIALYAYLNGLKNGEAAGRLAVELGIETADTAPREASSRKTTETVTPIIPVPEDASPFSWRHPQHGEPVAKRPYHNTDGQLVGYAARVEWIEGGDRKKDVLPITWCRIDHAGGFYHKWRAKGVPKPRPLYRVTELLASPNAPVIVCEGEKKADAVPAIFPGYVGTTSMGGSKAAANSDWSPLAGRDVTIWPDHDSPGLAYANTVARLAAEVGAASVHIVDVPQGWPESWDLADDTPDGVHADDLVALLQSARPWTAPDLASIEAKSQSEKVPAPGLFNAVSTDSEESIRAAIDAMTTGDRPGAQSVIDRIAAAKINPLIADELLGIIKQKTGLKAKALDQTLSHARRARGQSGGGDDDKESQATEIVALAVQSGAQFFHNAAGDAYATIEISAHKETWPIRSKALRGWLTKTFYDKTAAAPNSESLGAAINVLEAMARFDGKEIPVWLRVGEHEGMIYLDLCDADWRAIEIDADGWRIVTNPPVRFRRTAGMLPLPMPQQGGNIESLRGLLNVQNENSFTLAVAFLVGALKPHGPYSVLGLGGEYGAAKTSFARTIRDLIDPHSLPPRSLPREDRDLFVAATNGWLLAFDNVSSLPDWLSDSLCRLSTGGGFATRQLYSDGEEVLFEAMRPMILNGIEEFITRGDLADRSLLLTLKRLDNPITETELRAKFRKEHPGILGALLDAVSHGLKHLHETKLDKLPRMADFALWVTACEGALWETGTFIATYEANRAEATETVLEADPVAVAVRKFMTINQSWEGTATDLLARLSYVTSDAEKHERKWPKAGHALSGRLRRAAVGLHEVGVDVKFDTRGRDKTRVIVLEAVPRKIDAGAGALAGDQHAGASAASAGASAKKPWELALADAADAAGALFPTKGMQERARQVGGESLETARAPACQEVGEKASAASAPIVPRLKLPPGVWINEYGIQRCAGGIDFNDYTVQGSA
jgi:hypothetical protein